MKVLRFLRSNHHVRISQSQLNDIVAIVARRVDIETWVPKEETSNRFVYCKCVLDMKHFRIHTRDAGAIFLAVLLWQGRLPSCARYDRMQNSNTIR